MADTPEVDVEMSLDDAVDAFEAVEAIERDINYTFIAMSIDTLQELRPELTDDILAESQIIRGRDFVMIYNGSVMRGAMA